MIVLKSSRELELMKEACIISAQALQVAGEAVKPGVSQHGRLIKLLMILSRNVGLPLIS